MSRQSVSHGVRLAFDILAAAIVAAIFVGGARPEAVNLFPSPIDKLVHAAVFGLIAWLLWFGFHKLKAWEIFLIVTLIGLMDEVHQSFLPGRDAGWGDFATDFCAAGLVLILLSLDGESKQLRRLITSMHCRYLR